MSLNKIFRNTLLAISASILLSACAVNTTGKMQGDVYTGKDTVEYLAKYSTVSFPVYTSPCILPVVFTAHADNRILAEIASKVFLKILFKLITAP